MIDEKLQAELRAKYNPDGSTLRKAQLRMLEMLKFLDKVCKKNNIVYWIDSGTLIGAARHGGFIPWDDDMDVCMPYEDMLKFKSLMLRNNPSDEFVLQCHETDSGYYDQWIVLRDLKSEYIQDSELHRLRKYRGLQIDIFPLENTISSSCFLFSKLYVRGLIHEPLMGREGFKFLRPLVPITFFLFEKFLKPILQKYGRILREKPYYQMTYGCGFYSKRYLDTIYPIGDIEFEGFFFSSPKDVDAYLTHIYGNWKEIPKEIKTHNVKIVFKD